MEIKRRQFLGWVLASPLLGRASRSKAASHQMRASMRLLSAVKTAEGHMGLTLFSDQGESLLTYLLPDRAHQIIAHPFKPWLFAVARRPGTWLEVMNYETGQQVARIEAEAHHQFCGHAQITQDGRWLLTTEQSDQQSMGSIVVRDIENDFSVHQHWSSGGIGPHELKIAPDQKRLVVANGGILTEGRVNVNVDDMQPSLSYIDLASGELIETLVLDETFHQSGIRHIDVSPSGQVIIAMQYEGHPADQMPLIASHQVSQAIQVFDIPPAIHSQLKQYGGSACFDVSGRFAAVSAPKGNLVTFWKMPEGQFQGSVSIADACGLAADNQAGQFIVSSGAGGLYRVDAIHLRRELIQSEDAMSMHWDNHLSRWS
ncbi:MULTISPECIES: DUF1513 domain-containing protein [Nitrincola]|nr:MULTISPECIES: DUF1513 domain-containing protein [Nitrincola]